MTKLLAMDTTTDVCSVALVAGAQRFEHSRFAPRLHNRLLLAMIDDLLAVAGIDKRTIELIAFGAGPGSFTGVRIGAAVTQGLAFSLGARAVPVCSSAVAAEAVRRVYGRRRAVTVRRQSRPGWHYLATYQLIDDGVRCLEADRLVAEDAVPADALVVDGRLAVSARWVAELALRQADAAVASALALPIYVDGDHPWQAASASR